MAKGRANVDIGITIGGKYFRPGQIVDTEKIHQEKGSSETEKDFEARKAEEFKEAVGKDYILSESREKAVHDGNVKAREHARRGFRSEDEPEDLTETVEEDEDDEDEDDDEPVKKGAGAKRKR